MAACVQTPTLTSTEVTTSESLFPTSSVLTSTLPGSVSTSTFLTCTQSNSDIPCRSTVTSSIVTIPGNTTRLTVPVTGTIDVTITNLVTLFGSSCSTTSSSSPTTSTSSFSSSSSSSSSSSTLSFSISTPPPSLITSSSVITSDGSTFMTTFTSTSTSSPTTIDTSSSGTSFPSFASSTSSSVFTSHGSTSSLPPTTIHSSSSTSISATIHSSSSGTSLSNNASGQNSSKKSSNAGPIAGGVVGGLVVLALLGLLTWRLIKKQSRFDDVFNKAPKPHYKKTSARDPEPKPYDYGLVGQNITNPTGLDGTTPTSPPPNQSSFGNDVGSQGGNTNDVGHQGGNTNNVGYQGGNDIGNVPNQPPLQHMRNPSLTPLLAGVGAAAAAATANAVNSSRPTSSRPSSSASSQPSGPLVTNASPGQGYPPLPSSSYPSALQSWSNPQGHAPTNAQGGYPSPATTNAQGYGSGPTMAGHSTGMSQSGSVNSIGSNPSAYSTSTSGGPSASGGSGGVYNPVLPGIMPVIAAAGMRNQSNQNAAAQRSQLPEDPFARSGSPVSIQEQRILQVTNGEPSSPRLRTSVYDPNAYYSGQTETSSSSSAAAGSPSGRRQSRSSSYGAVDGKGRPLNLRGEKAPVVHLDGGLYQEVTPGAPNAAVGSAPPAYEARME